MDFKARPTKRYGKFFVLDGKKIIVYFLLAQNILF